MINTDDELTCRSIYSTASMDLIRDALHACASPKDFFDRVEEISASAEMIPYRPAISFAEALTAAGNERIENAILVYDAVGSIDRVNASDPRLWTYLALNTCREFMEARWPLTGCRAWKKRVESRWLMPERPSRSNLTRHGIARLWWLTELTYDGQFKHSLSRNSQDPYAYTKWLIGNQDRVVSITERNFGGNDVVRWALMETMIEDERTNKGKAIKSVSQDLCLELSFRDLGVLGAEAEAEINRIRMLSVNSPV